MKRRVYIVDDNATLRLGLRRLIERDNTLTVVGEAATLAESMEALDNHAADIYIVDLGLGPDDGMDLVTYISEHHPDVRKVVLSWHNEHVYRERSLNAGADGYVVKSDSPAELVDTILSVLD